MVSWGPKLSSCRQRRLWSDWVEAQADLSFHWAHMPFCCFFFMRWLISAVWFYHTDKWPKDADRMVNSGPTSDCLIWVHIVCSNMSVQKLSIITVSLTSSLFGTWLRFCVSLILVWLLFYGPSTHFRSFQVRLVTLTTLFLCKPPMQFTST